MVNHYIQHKDEDIVEAVIKMLEKDSGQKIFTIRIINENRKPYESLEFVAAFESKEMMMGIIFVETTKKRLAVRLKGKYL
jgi:hypothetical protein